MDGNYSLEDTESAIQEQEASGREMTTLQAGDSNPPTNEVDFKDLDAGEMPDELHLTPGKIPPGQKQVWAGQIYISGKLQKARAYRTKA